MLGLERMLRLGHRLHESGSAGRLERAMAQMPPRRIVTTCPTCSEPVVAYSLVASLRSLVGPVAA